MVYYFRPILNTSASETWCNQIGSTVALAMKSINLKGGYQSLNLPPLYMPVIITVHDKTTEVFILLPEHIGNNDTVLDS